MLSINATALVVFAVVWILVLVLTRIFFKPMLRILDERADRIAKDKAAAERARKSTEDDLKRLVREVQAEGRAEVEKAKAALAREIEALKKDLDKRTEEIAVDIEKRILGE
jgi:F-type H+-transporting ATPase subunit b